VLGCQNSNNTAACDDGDACTTGDTCGGGVCNGGPPPSCNDGNVCTDDTCDPVLGCQNTNNTAACDDGDTCTTVDTCSSGVCVGGSPLNCDDGNVCTDDTCDPVLGCQNTTNTAACDDGNACTTADTCSGGACVGGAPPNCNDGNICTTDSCVPATGCVNANNTAACNDGDACTTGDTCGAGVCNGGPAPNCNDGNICTTDSCDPVLGCQNSNNTIACDDGNACTTGDTCGGGVCNGGPPASCDDGNVCTTDSCNPVTGCANTNNAAACDDGNGCTVRATGNCQFVLNDANCADGNLCNGAEVCDPVGDCQPGAGPCPVETNPPNREGGHGEHNALANVTSVCATCHSGAGTGTSSHFNGQNNVAFGGNTYDAKNGTATHNPDSTCSAVSCHGGQTTPNWFTGRIDVNRECLLCHQVLDLGIPSTDQFNSPASGEHDFHVNGEGYDCRDCHDTTKLTPIHFNDLNTPAVNEAGQTLKNGLNYDPLVSPRTCNPSSDQGLGCHFSEPTPREWP
jgi:hypothetical protein